MVVSGQEKIKISRVDAQRLRAQKYNPDAILINRWIKTGGWDGLSGQSSGWTGCTHGTYSTQAVNPLKHAEWCVCVDGAGGVGGGGGV